MENSVKNAIYGAVSGAVVALLVLAGAFYTGNWEPRLDQEDQNNSDITVDFRKNFVSEEDLVVAAVKKAEPAVVSIIITKNVPVMERFYEESPFGFGDPFSFKIPQYRQNGTEKKEVGGGSGFIASADGYVVTNKHVVEEDPEAEYSVFTSDGTEYKGKVLARDPLNDIAILKIDAKELPFLNFGNSDSLKLGQTVIAIGNPLLEFTNSVSKGVVSGLSRSIVAGSPFGASEQLENVIQTDAAINPGNSGGPLVDLNGEVIGVNVAVASAENIGFSLPANMVKKVVSSVRETGEIVRPFLGVRYVPINEAMKEANNLEVNYGVLVVRGETPEQLAIVPGSPADKAGLEENDIILEVDGTKLEEGVSLARLLSEKNVGDKVKFKILHDGAEKMLEIELEQLPKQGQS